MLEVGFKVGDTTIEMTDAVFKSSGYMFNKMTRDKPENRQELRAMYVGMIRNISGDIIHSTRDTRTKDRIYTLNMERIEYHLALNKFKNPTIKEFHPDAVSKFDLKIAELFID